MTSFALHHPAISVVDLERSKVFYAYFGFREVFRWDASDASLTISHLRDANGQFLEIVCYADGRSGPLPGVGNNLDVVGVKHIAFRTDDVAAVHADMAARGLGELTELQHGRTRVDLFFVRDPDGFWVEVLTDQRDLDEAHPTYVTETPRLLTGE